MNTKQLRQKVLDLAIRGKLVPQDPNDEPASVLLEKIRAEKERLIKEKKIKPDKKNGGAKSHYQNVPFEVPKGWVWCRLEIITINRDGERIPLSQKIRQKQRSKTYDYYGATGVIDKVESYIFSERLLLVGEDGANLLSRNKDNAFFAEGNYWVNNHAHVLDATNKQLLDYIAIVLNTISFEPYITGSAQPKLTQDNLNKINIPLPPLAEQHRIVATIESAFAEIDKIEQNKIDLQQFIKQTKSKVLDLAIRGKLVPQNSNDEPASALLERIGNEQKPKKGTADKFPYAELPRGWELVSLREICRIVPSKPYQILQSDIKNKGKYPVVSQSSSYVEGYFDDIKKVFKIEKPIIVFGDHTRNVKYIDFDFIIGADGVKILTSQYISTRYFYFLITYASSKIVDRGYSRHYQFLEKYPLLIPPLAEQQRIVQKIETIFETLDLLQENLETSV